MVAWLVLARMMEQLLPEPTAAVVAITAAAVAGSAWGGSCRGGTTARFGRRRPDRHRARRVRSFQRSAVRLHVLHTPPASPCTAPGSWRSSASTGTR